MNDEQKACEAALEIFLPGFIEYIFTKWEIRVGEGTANGLDDVKYCFRAGFGAAYTSFALERIKNQKSE
jgi:hypothetical protein